MPLPFENRLIKNMETFKEMENRVLPLGLSKDELMAILKDQAEKSFALLNDNNKRVLTKTA